MAEGGIIDKLIGNDEFEGPEATEAAQAAISADTVATIVAMDAARFDPSLSRKAADYLDKQRELTALAIKHFDVERHLAIDQARLAIRAARRKAISDRLRIGLQIVLAFIPLIVVAGMAVLIYDAVTSRSVVVDTFQAPAALAPTGATGQVVAEGVLDELQKLQNATYRVPDAAPLSTKSAWSSDVKIEVPDTGISIGEIDRLLRQHLGHDIHIDGDLVQTTAGLELTVRGDGVPPQTFSGGSDDLNKITSQAAEYLYGRSQPREYSIYLINNLRYQDLLTFVSGAYSRSQDKLSRAYLASYWGLALEHLNRPAEAIEKFRLSISLPTSAMWGTRVALIEAVADTEGEEAAWQEARSFMQAAEAAPQGTRPRPGQFFIPAAALWDVPQLLTSRLAANPTNNAGEAINDNSDIALVYALLHDAAGASRYLSLSDPNSVATKYVGLILPVLQAADRNTPAAAVTEAEAFWKFWLATPSMQHADDFPCIAALPLGMAARTAEANIIFQRLGRWSRCAAAHGQVLEHQGKLAEAEAVWAEGIRIAPDLPPVYMARGVSEMNRGELQAAEADFAKASVNAPHFADPLKDYGDLLAREGRWKEALAKYDQALKYAPNWPALHQARDIAAGKA